MKEEKCQNERKNGRRKVEEMKRKEKCRNER